jgi:hypothetical protein
MAIYGALDRLPNNGRHASQSDPANIDSHGHSSQVGSQGYLCLYRAKSVLGTHLRRPSPATA